MSDLLDFVAKHVDVDSMHNGDKLFIYNFRCPACKKEWFKATREAIKNRRLVHAKCPNAWGRYQAKLEISTVLRYTHSIGRPCESVCHGAQGESCTCSCGGQFHGAARAFGGELLDEAGYRDLMLRVGRFNKAQAQRRAAARLEAAAA